MKNAVLSGVIIAVCMLIIPLINIKSEGSHREEKAVQTAAKTEAAEAKQSENRDFRIKTDAGIEILSKEDYIVGVVAAEMPVSFGKEALKAQSVAAYTFALYRKEKNKDNDYDLTDSYKTDQCYLSLSSLKEKWGEEYESRIAAVREAVSDTAGEYLSYGGETALTLYHAISAGVTNDCADVFGSKLDYLVSVDSEADKLSPNYKSVFSFSAGELAEKLASVANIGSGNAFSDIKLSESGFVKEIKYGGETVSGRKICELLSLPSPAFSVEFDGGAYTFTCSGRGHGVGMSQYGAGQLAAAGKTYREILAHYYPGTKLEKS